MAKALTIGMFVMLAAILSGSIYVANMENAYYCESRDLAAYCFKLSSGMGYRCYYDEMQPTKWKACPGGWQSLGKFVQIEEKDVEEFRIFANGENYYCKKDAGDYTKCVSESGKHAYLGELL